MKKLYFLIVCFLFLLPKSSEANCDPPTIVNLVQEGQNQFLLNWIDINGANNPESVTVLLDFQLCSGLSFQESHDIFPLIHTYFDFTTDPNLVIASITAVVIFNCEDGSTAPPTTPVVLDLGDCQPCFSVADLAIRFNCDRQGLLCVEIDEIDQASGSTSDYQICDIGGNDTAGACYDLSTLPEGTTSLPVTLCEWRTGGCDNQACCIVVDVAVPACADDCPALPLTFDWCCSIFGNQPACLCATGPDGETYAADQLPDGYWIPEETMNIPGICIYPIQLPPPFEPVTFTVNDVGNNCSYVIEMPGPDCWPIIDDGGGDGNFQGEDFLQGNSVALFPNPATEIITIENNFNEIINYEIIDAQGKYLNKGNMKIGDTQLNIQDYEPGVYFLKYKSTPQETTTLRFIKI